MMAISSPISLGVAYRMEESQTGCLHLTLSFGLNKNDNINFLSQCYTCTCIVLDVKQNF